MKMLRFFVVLFGASLANAATYYVTTNGNDSANGSVGTPWLTIQKAANTMVAGDTVNVGPGSFNEFITCPTSGTPGNPIMFNGTRSGTNWATMIEPSTLVTGSWSAAPEIGAGVWKKTMPLETKELTLDGKRCGFVFTTGALGGYNPFSHTPTLTTGAEYLALPNNELVGVGGVGIDASFWDGTGALWAVDGTTTYLRLRDGSSPDSHVVRIAPNLDGYVTPGEYNSQAILMYGRSNIVWQNFEIKGAFAQIYCRNCDNITIRSNLLEGGTYRVLLYNGTRNVTIANNELTGNFYGYASMGAWSGGSSTKAALSEMAYERSKYLEGQSSQFDYDVMAYLCSSNITVIGNYSHHTCGNGFYAESEAAYPFTSNLIICSNTFVNHPSSAVAVGQYTSARIYDNVFRDNNANFRPHHCFYGDTGRTLHFYRNLCWLPAGEGDHTFVNFDGWTNTNECPLAWFYHNSFSGGRYGVYLGSAYAVPRFGWVNNIWSSNYWFRVSGGTLTTAAPAGMDYNLLAKTTMESTPAWLGASNIVQAAAEWASTNTSMTLSTNSAALNAALDLTQSFTLKGTNYSALPQDGTTKTGASWDIGALEYSSGGSTNTPSRAYVKNLRVNTLKVR